MLYPIFSQVRRKIHGKLHRCAGKDLPSQIVIDAVRLGREFEEINEIVQILDNCEGAGDGEGETTERKGSIQLARCSTEEIEGPMNQFDVDGNTFGPPVVSEDMVHSPT